MIKPVLASRRSIGFLGTAAKPAAAVSWWLSGGIAAANCIAAYQPKGATSLAASYTNLANPGTYNAAPGTAPTWNATNGWIFNGSSQYLTTGISPGNGYSMIVRYSNMTNDDSYMVGAQNSATERFWMTPRSTVNYWLYGNGTKSSTGSTTGIMALAGDTGYYNGNSAVTSIGTWSNFSTPRAIFFGNINLYGSPSSGSYCPVYIQAAAIYSTTISAAQVSALTTAMAAL